MSKIVTYFNLFPIPDSKDFLGIAADRDEENVITTLARNIVVVLKIRTQKQIHSWSTLEKLSSKVVFDRRSEKYVGVFANHALRLWDENTTDINKCKKLKFQKSIAALVGDTADNETLVLYSDGSCEPLSSALTSRKDQVQQASIQMAIAASQTLTDARVSDLANGQKVLTYFQRNNQTGQLTLESLSLTNGEIRSYPINRENLILSGYAVIEGDNAPMLLTIWSDKRIFLLSLNDNTQTSQSPGNFVSMLTELDVESNISVLGISRHSVAIYGANHGQEGSSLLLYNTQFKVVKAKQFFKVYFKFSRLWSTQDHILLAMGQNISVVTYHMSKEFLAELIGTQNNNENFNPIEMDHINEEEQLEQCIQFDKDTEPFGNGEATISSNKPLKYIEPLEKADGIKTAFQPVDDFDKQLADLSRMSIHTELLMSESSVEEAQIALLSKHNDDGGQNILMQMIIRLMERCGASEQEISEKLLNVLIKVDNPEIVLMCLRRYANISERQIANALLYALEKCKTEKPEEISRTEQKSTNGLINDVEMEPSASKEVKLPTGNYQDVDLLVPRRQVDDSYKPYVLLNAVLACSFDPDTITEHIRNVLDVDAVILLLKHLLIILDDPLVIFEDQTSSEPNCVKFEMQVFRWFSVVLSAHFQKLALAKDSDLLNLLYDWQKVFIAYRAQLVELQEVGALLHKLVQRRKTQEEKSYSKWYSIEEVVLF